MRVVICADAHLDSFFPMFSKNDEKSLIRQEDQRAAFLKVIDEVKRIDAHLLIIPGDLFCADRVTHSTIFFLKKTFASIKDTYVLITPGNNDPAVAGSPYLSQDWSDNVYIFKSGLEALEFNFDDTNESVRIYGVGFQSHTSKKSLLKKNPILDKNFINIFISHGQLCDDGESSNYNPLYKSDLDSCGFDLCALGHVHKKSGLVSLNNTNYIYTGPCEGRNFYESNMCGAYSGTINKDYIDLKFIPTSLRENILLDIDISHFNNNYEIIEEIRQKCTEKDNIYKVKLIGSPLIRYNLSINEITKTLSSEYFYIKIVPNFQFEVDTEAMKNENNLRGFFVKCMEEKLEQSYGDNEKILHDAMVYGLCALEKEVFADEDY